MIAKRKTPEGLEDYESLRVKNFKSDMINDVISLSAGLDMAIENINPGEITKKAKTALCDLVASSYGLFAYRIAHNILLDEGLVNKEEAVTDLLYRFDLPDDSHDDVVIYFKRKA